MNKIGIFSGTFDPVHAGHIAFALEAIEQAGLEAVYFMPEQLPRRKEGVTHYAHRVAMLRIALRPYKKLDILDVVDRQFTTSRTLPKIRAKAPGAKIYQLVGSDLIDLLSSEQAEQQWPDYRRFLDVVTLIVGIREEKDSAHYATKLKGLQTGGILIASKRPYASSRDIRSAVRRGKEHKELLDSIRGYIAEHWLYASLDTAPNNS